MIGQEIINDLFIENWLFNKLLFFLVRSQVGQMSPKCY